MLYESTKYVQPMEIGVSSGYVHVGVSVKSERKEFFAGQFDMLTDEKSRHDVCAIADAVSTKTPSLMTGSLHHCSTRQRTK